MAATESLADFELRAGQALWIVEMDRSSDELPWVVRRHDGADFSVLFRRELFQDAVWDLAEEAGSEAAKAAATCDCDQDALTAWFARWALEDGGWEALIKTAAEDFIQVAVDGDDVRRIRVWTDAVQAMQLMSVDSGD